MNKITIRKVVLAKKLFAVNGFRANFRTKNWRLLLSSVAVVFCSCIAAASNEIDGFGRAVGNLWNCGGRVSKDDLSSISQTISISRDVLLKQEKDIQEACTAGWYAFAEMQFCTFSNPEHKVSKEDCIKNLLGDSDGNNGAIQLATTIVKDFPQTKYARAAFELTEAIAAFMRDKYAVEVTSLRKEGYPNKIKNWKSAICRNDLVTCSFDFHLDLTEQIFISRSGYLKSQYEDIRTNLQNVASQKKAGGNEWFFDFCKYDDKRREYMTMISEQREIACGDSHGAMIKGAFGVPLGLKIDEMDGKVSYVGRMGIADLTLNHPAKPFDYNVSCKIHPKTRIVASLSLSGASSHKLTEIAETLEKEYGKKFKQVGKYRWEMRIGTRRINLTQAMHFGNDIRCFVVDEELQWEADRAWATQPKESNATPNNIILPPQLPPPPQG